MFGNNISRVNNNPSCKGFLNSKSSIFEDCTVIEKTHSFHNLPKGQDISVFSKGAEEERPHGNSFGTKRTHLEMSSLKNENIKSQASNEDANTDVTYNRFVSARAKLVTVL
ncbi:hypothetical protein U1Q18_001125, partial [Sarracenia purpurea var. burkii]